MAKAEETIPMQGKLKLKKPTILTRFFVTLLLLLGLFVSAASIKYMITLFTPTSVYSYQACEKSLGSKIEKTYPKVCVTRDGNRFVEKTPEEEERLLETSSESVENKLCGGIMGIICPEGYSCQYDGNYPDASGKCVKNLR